MAKKNLRKRDPVFTIIRTILGGLCISIAIFLILHLFYEMLKFLDISVLLVEREILMLIALLFGLLYMLDRI